MTDFGVGLASTSTFIPSIGSGKYTITFVGSPSYYYVWVYILVDGVYGQDLQYTYAQYPSPQNGDSFGASLAAYDNFLAVGDPGVSRVSLFRIAESDGSLNFFRLLQFFGPPFFASETFGRTLAMQSDILVVGDSCNGKIHDIKIRFPNYFNFHLCTVHVYDWRTLFPNVRLLVTLTPPVVTFANDYYSSIVYADISSISLAGTELIVGDTTRGTKFCLAIE